MRLTQAEEEKRLREEGVGRGGGRGEEEKEDERCLGEMSGKGLGEVRRRRRVRGV